MYSFSQNFEDVYIYRAFRDVNNGFYIDAGAFDPIVDSVTKMLYDLGWSGINLEPGPSFTAFSSRTRDINLSFALSSTNGEIEFYYNPADPGTSTVAATNVPRQAGAVQSYKVPTATLEAIVKTHAPDRHIHFLKLDIEGAEWDVLSNTNWHAIRPELIIAEACIPYTNERRDVGWADHMRAFGYEEVFFDGINVYYLRNESLHRRDAFRFPVNVLDNVRKFDPQQHHSLTDADSFGLIERISQEVGRVVDEEGAAVRGYLETDLRPRLKAQQDLIEKLTADQSEHFSRLREIAAKLSDFGSNTERSSSSSRGGNSIEAVIEDLAQGVADLAEQGRRQSAELAHALEAADEARAAQKDREKLADEARSEARRLAKRLKVARHSRMAMLELTERVAGALHNAGTMADPVNLSNGAPVQKAQPFESSDNTADLVQRVGPPRQIRGWRKALRFRSRGIVRLADTYRDSGRYAEAADEYARAYALRPDRVDLCLQLANMLTQAGKLELAEEAYREALERSPDDGLVLLHFGHMLELAHRPEEAQRAYRESAALIPDHPDVVKWLAKTNPSQDAQ